MSSEDFPDVPPEGPSLDAAEYVLRLLSDDAHQALSDRVARDPAFAEEVRFWEDHFAGLAAELPPVLPRATLADRVADSIAPRAANLNREVNWWRGFAAVAGALVLGLSVALYEAYKPADIPPTRGAALTDGQNLMMHALIEVGGDRLRITPIRPLDIGPDRDLELWAMLPDQAPRSLGIVSQTSQEWIDLPAEIAAALDTVVLLISNEPLGGSPTGAPTGEILTQSRMTEF